ncbi:MAG: replication initiation protein [bacterium]|jgi:hypothetical protein
MKSISDILKTNETRGIKNRITLSSTDKVTKNKKRGVPETGLVVFQHNNLIEANYKLSLQEKRVILWLISQIKPNDEDFKEHILKIDEFIKIAGLSGESCYKEIKKITFKLIGNVLRIRNLDKNGETQVSWLSSANYMDDEGRVSLRFDPAMKPFLIELKNHFTAIELSDLMQFNSVYSMRIYELLKQYENIGERTIEIATIRKYCGIQNKLNQYKEFKERVLLMAQRELNAKSDISFTFEEIKTVRKITSIRFIISKNANKTSITQQTQQPKRLPPIFFMLEEFGISKKIIYRILKENEELAIVNAINAVDIQIKKGKVRNPKAMLLTAIKEKWHPDVFRVKMK